MKRRAFLKVTATATGSATVVPRIDTSVDPDPPPADYREAGPWLKRQKARAAARKAYVDTLVESGAFAPTTSANFAEVLHDDVVKAFKK